MTQFKTILRKWKVAHSEVEESQLYEVDEDYANQAGFPTLSAVCHELAKLQRSQSTVANGHLGIRCRRLYYVSGREVETMLRRVLSVAVGEASERVRLILDDQSHGGVPGIPTIPKKLAEIEGREVSEAESDLYDFQDGNGPVPAHRHLNPDGSKGGWVADTATVAATATIGEDAKVFGSARVFGSAHVSENARVYGSALVSVNACVYGSACVYGDAMVSGKTRVYGKAQVSR